MAHNEIGEYPKFPLVGEETIRPGTVRGPQIGPLMVDVNGNYEWIDKIPNDPDYAPYALIGTECVDTRATLDPDQSGCGTSAVKIDSQKLRLAPSSSYPDAYNKLWEEWSNDPSANKTDTPPTDPGFEMVGDRPRCRSDSGFINVIPSGKQSEIQDKVSKACALFKNVVLDPNTQPTVNMVYPITGNSVTMAGTFSPATECSGSRPVVEDVCNKVLSSIIKDCDTDTADFKYGGFKHDNCIIWDVTVLGDVRQRDPVQTPGSSGRISPGASPAAQPSSKSLQCSRV
jgi:hypothetical protein